ncbi:hypothetical protein [Pontiella sulfatireligans]|nr:hypothetical protein [Pontiella sulfatireligans]
MNESGELFERYNSARKANLTVLSVSVLVLGALGYFELTRSRRLALRRGYGDVRHRRDEPKDLSDGLESTSIYCAPETVDVWKGRRLRTPRSHSKDQVDIAEIWMVFLRVGCVVFPSVYLGLLAFQLIYGFSGTTEFTLLVSAFSVLALVSVVAAFGLLKKKPWGLASGYLLAILNLVVFPYGTAGGLFLLVGLVGATPTFVIPARERQRVARHKAAKKARASMV